MIMSQLNVNCMTNSTQHTPRSHSHSLINKVVCSQYEVTVQPERCDAGNCKRARDTGHCVSFDNVQLFIEQSYSRFVIPCASLKIRVSPQTDTRNS